MREHTFLPGRWPLEFGHTCLNYFIVLDGRGRENLPMESLTGLAEILCATPMADNLLVLQDSREAEVRLRIFGGDGNEADFCGNGVAYTSQKAGEEMGKGMIRVETASGVKAAVRLDEGWKIEIGQAMPLNRELSEVPRSLFQGKSVIGLIRAGEPHLVLDRYPAFGELHVHRKDFEDYCRPLRDITGVKGGVSITMVFENKGKRMVIRTFERGARRQTFSCGTGSVSAVAALFGRPADGSVFDVFSPGGSHKVMFESGRWYLIAGPQRIGTGYFENSTIYLPLSGLWSYRP
jgi:diaminopimelate epimerase